ncbi:hypothetical protein VW35_06000 [Devosia soli]|uniref:Uncharacterized protein n=2 Tax=Devosia soli TaxID=361041 RepID=A0A0F5LCJ9_9HYPH|nr:hypothetical protein VW35_06000 [Devosia soli]
MFTGAMLVVSLALATPASADKGQCSLTDYDTFDCDVATDGGGLTFGLPDGQVFAFALTDDDEGLGYRIPADATPGQRPVELGIFEPLPGQPGCWRALRNDTKFCASVFE